MKNTKKKNIIPILTTVLLAIVTIGFMYSNGIEDTYNQAKILPAKLEIVESFDHLDDISVLIVKGTMTGDRSIIEEIDPEYDQVIDKYTRTTFEVTELLKNQSSKELNTGDQIAIRENSWIDEKTTYAVAGYKLMEEGNEYLLFLGEDSENDYFYPRGVLFGKINTDESTIKLREKRIASFTVDVTNDEVNDLVLKIHSDALAKYNK